MKLEVVQADITTLKVDAIVNAANTALLPGGGVCGAIHAAAGPKLAEASAAEGPCVTGDAKITPGFDLPARFVIHAVGPVWHGGDQDEDALLASCYRRSVELAEQAGCKSIAFPAISTGIFGYPPERAAPIAVKAAHEAATTLETIIFCCFDCRSASLHREAVAALEGGGA